MKKLGLGILIGITVLGLSLSLAFAQGKLNGGNSKAQAPEIERGVFVDYGYNSPPWYPQNCDDPLYATDRYQWGPKIRWAIPSIAVKVNPTASGFVLEEELDAVVGEVEKGFTAWDGASGPFAVTVSRDDTEEPSLDIPDYTNTVSWGIQDGPGGIIAVTNYWYFVNTKELIDTDIIFDVAESWSISPVVPENKFDVWNIATHEAGHTLLLGDLPSPKSCGLTMHAYTWLGDTLKRDLGSGDILGVQAIYGE